MLPFFFFFFSSRRRHTRLTCDWSSDVCSSDLADGTFDVESFQHVVDVMILAQEIVVGPSSYPTEEIGRNARAFRQLGLGYANLGALLMADGKAYDSGEGRAVAAAVTALMTGRAYRKSAEVAAAIGPYESFPEKRDAHLRAMG